MQSSFPDPTTTMKLPSLEKHGKYRNTYQPNTLYWGMGIEHEVYLEVVDLKMTVPTDYFFSRHQPERYSHDYIRQSYKVGVYEAAIVEWIQQFQQGVVHVALPVLMKSHSFLKTDVQNEPQTVYSKTTPPNPKFNGKTLLESLQEVDPYFVDTLGKEWVFDGDTIEFNTLAFFNTTLDAMMDELSTTQQTFVQHLNAALAQIPNKHAALETSRIDIMRHNYAFALYMTNVSNVNMFNNGTLHFNLTLPTQLDASCNIVNIVEFTQQHKRAIHAIQWLEPLIVAVYGSPDPFSALINMPDCFSKASQRCAVSRYIGLGTYDTDSMSVGKCNTVPTAPTHAQQRWFPLTYLKLPDMGLDINFRKHHNHGIELRCLDHIGDPAKIREVWLLLIHLMDVVLASSPDDFLKRPTADPVWIELTRQCMIHGATYVLTDVERDALDAVFGTTTSPHGDIREVLAEWQRQWTRRFQRSEKRDDGTWCVVPTGGFSQFVLRPQVLLDKQEIAAAACSVCCLQS